MSITRTAVTAAFSAGPGLASKATGSFTPAVGDTITVLVAFEADTPNACTIAVSDTIGNTWVPLTIKRNSTNAHHVQIFYCLSNKTSSADVVTATVTGDTAQKFLVEATRFTSSAGSIAFNAQASGTGTSTAPATTAFSAGDFAVGILKHWFNGALTAASGWTADFNTAADEVASIFRVDSPGGTYTAGGTFTGSDVWTIAAASFVSGSANVTLSLAGQTATFSEGTVTAAPSYALAAQSVTSSEGAIALSASYSLTGQAGTFSEGALTASISYGVGGQSASFAQGSISSEVDYSLLGQTATFTEGTITASTGGNVTLSLAGQTGTFSQGAIGYSVTYGLSGQSITSAEGSIGAEADYGLGAQTATFAQGIITAQAGGDVSVQIGSLQAFFSEGQITVTGGDIIATEVPAGRRTRRRQQYIIKIDSQEFVCTSVAQALDLLRRAREAAALFSVQQTQKAGLDFPHLPALQVPKIEVNSRDLRAAVTHTRREISLTYRQVLIDAELKMHFAIDARERENVETLLLLM